MTRLLRWITLTCLPLALLAALAGPAPAQQGTPCGQAISCDCEAIDAGLLTRSWKQDCRACQSQIVAACEAAFPPLGPALAAGGFCEDACSVTGPNPTPRPSKPIAGLDESGPRPANWQGVWPPSFGETPLVQRCPENMHLQIRTEGAYELKGCVLSESGRAEGVWVFVDTEANEIVEILYLDGEEIERTRRPRG